MSNIVYGQSNGSWTNDAMYGKLMEAIANKKHEVGVALLHKCPTCGVRAGRRCKRMEGEYIPSKNKQRPPPSRAAPHAARIAKAMLAGDL